jgi:tRNA pseudouridine55 synthase
MIDRRRDVDGILLLDKPRGLTSNQALQKAKRLLNARKAGHTGSLDPLATGLLPLCFGEATKISAYLLDADKGYRVTCQLGAATATGDADGEISARAPVPALTEADIERAFQSFRGRISQTPPMYSALKHGGKRLYELAREGKQVERKPREIEIHDLRLVGLTSDGFEYDVQCSKGTYVRTLTEDIARTLGTLAHVTALRRYKVGGFGEAGSVTLAALEERAGEDGDALDTVLAPMDGALAHWPAVDLDGDSAFYFARGQAVFVAGAPADGWVRTYGPARAFLGLGAVDSSGKIAPRRLIRQK